MTRKECIEKIEDVVFSLGVMLDIIQCPGDEKIRFDCETYEDEAQNIADALKALSDNFGHETRSQFVESLSKESTT